MNIKKLLSAACLIALSSVVYTPAFAAYHEEERIYDNGKVVLYLGWYPDPPYAEEPSGLYILPYADAVFDENGDFVDGRHIIVLDNKPDDPSTHPEDKVDITGTVQLLEYPGPDAPILEEEELPGPLIEEFEGFYITHFIPNKAGAYAFVLSGEINGIALDHERFVCKPTDQLHSLEFDGFSCVKERENTLPYAPIPLPQDPYKQAK